MKKKARLTRRAKKAPVAKKKYKSYYVPVAQREKNSKKKATTKKKYKSYYKSKKQRELEAAQLPTTQFEQSIKKVKSKDVGSALIAPLNKKVVDETAINTPVVPVEKVSKRPVKYLNNKDLLAQVILSKKQGKMSNELAKMLMLLTQRYGKKGNFANYTYNDDMQCYALYMVCKTWQGFDPAKSSNPFAWFTQCIKNSFIQYLNLEKRQRDIKDGVLVDNGFSPSYSYQQEYAQEYHSNGGGDPGENVNVELQEKSGHNHDTFEVEDSEEVPTSDTM